MKPIKIYWIICIKFRKFVNPNIPDIFNKTLVLYFIYSKCRDKHDKMFKKEDSIEILKTIGLNE